MARDQRHRCPREVTDPAFSRTSPARPPSLSWSIHRDLARLLTDWRAYTRRLGRDAYSFLLVLEALRLESRDTDIFRYRDLEKTLAVSPATLRRWLRILRTVGLLTIRPVPGTNRMEGHFTIHLDGPPVPSNQRRKPRK